MVTKLLMLQVKIRIYLAILAKLLKLQRFDSINYLPSVRECSIKESFPDQRQVVYTVETLEFQKFSQNS